MSVTPEEATRLLHGAALGDSDAEARLLPAVYQQLRSVARSLLSRQRPGQTLQATELVHEAYLRLIRQDSSEWRSLQHFLAVGARAMRQILIDRARARAAGQPRADLDLDQLAQVYEDNGIDLLALGDALEILAERDPTAARIAELRIFVGLNAAETADVLQLPLRTTQREWTVTRAWLHGRLGQLP